MRDRTLLLVAILAVAAVGIAVGFRFLPPPATRLPTSPQYANETMQIPLPAYPQNTTAPTQTVFRGIAFEVWVRAWYSPAGGFLCGTGTEPNGTEYAFTISGIPSPNPWKTWMSPDGVFGVQWTGGAEVYLLVRV